MYLDDGNFNRPVKPRTASEIALNHASFVVGKNVIIKWVDSDGINDYTDGMKYGRLIFKKEIELEWNGIPYKRNKFVIENGFPLNEEGNKEKFISLIKYKDKL